MEISLARCKEKSAGLLVLIPAELMGVVNYGLLILLVAIITLSNNEFRFLFYLVSQNLTNFKENEDFSALDYTFMITMSYFRTQTS
jgi:hypothetical protein